MKVHSRRFWYFYLEVRSIYTIDIIMNYNGYIDIFRSGTKPPQFKFGANIF